MLHYRFLPYIYSVSQGQFVASCMNYRKTGAEIHAKLRRGLTSEDEITVKRQLYGKCLLDVPVKSVAEILVGEILHPFYVFQIFSVVVWMLDAYYYYPIVILAMAAISVVSALLMIQKQMAETRAMAHYVCDVRVYRGHPEPELMSSEHLLPGDLFEVPIRQRVPCDAVIVEGSCMVDESMLTGESVPILKSAIPQTYTQRYNPDQATLHSLYEGTQVTEN
jgi:magnesium-transporting ATPase (P-type)